MKKLSIILVLFLAINVFAKENNSHEQAAQKLFASMEMEKTMSLTIEKMLDMQIKGNPALAPYRKTLSDFLKKYMSWESIQDKMLKLYVDSFTEKEIGQLVKFYKSKLGKKVIRVLPDLSMKASEIGQNQVKANMSELIQMLEVARKEQEAKDKSLEPGTKSTESTEKPKKTEETKNDVKKIK